MGKGGIDSWEGSILGILGDWWERFEEYVGFGIVVRGQVVGSSEREGARNAGSLGEVLGA